MEFKDESKVLFCKLHPDAIIPSKRVEDSGYDIYALFDEDYVVIKPHETKILHTGLASVFSDRYGMFYMKEEVQEQKVFHNVVVL